MATVFENINYFFILHSLSFSALLLSTALFTSRHIFYLFKLLLFLFSPFTPDNSNVSLFSLLLYFLSLEVPGTSDV